MLHAAEECLRELFSGGHSPNGGAPQGEERAKGQQSGSQCFAGHLMRVLRLAK